MVWWNPTTWRAGNSAEGEVVGPFSVSDPRAAFVFGGGAEWALKSPTTLAAIRAISETAGNLPLHCFKYAGDGERSRDRKHFSDTLLNKRANRFEGPYALRTRLIQDALLYGRGMAVATRSGGKVTELRRVPHGAGTVDCTGLVPVYNITMSDGQVRQYSASDVVDVLTPGSTIENPLKLVDQARDAIALDIMMARYFSGLMSKGAKPRAIITARDQKQIPPDTWAKLKDFFRQQLNEPEADGTLFIPGDLQWTQQQFSSVDLEFSAMHTAVKTEIAKAFMVPPTRLMDFGRATWSNSAEMGQQFLQNLLPWLASVEWAMTRVLLANDDTRFLEHVTFELTKPNMIALFNAGRQATGGAVMSVNEWRAIALNAPPLDGGDELIRQAGQTGATDETSPKKDDGDPS